MSSIAIQTSFNPSLLTSDIGPRSLQHILRERGCSGCELGEQVDLVAPVVGRGNPVHGRIIIGEAPGLNEDKEGRPFCGKAGKLLDQIFLSVGWDTNTDWYLTNLVLCRPIAPAGSYKQNLTPSVLHRQSCRPYIEHQLDYQKWHIAVLLGKVAVSGIFPELSKEPMYNLAGRVLHTDRWPDTTFFVLYHPAALLHGQKTPEKYELLKQTTKNNIASLRQAVDEMETL